MAESSERQQVIARALTDVLVEGEIYVVRHVEDGVEVAAGNGVQLKHPRLYGRLLALHEQINDAGNMLTMACLLGVAVLCLGIHLEWWDAWVGDGIEKLRSVWFYIVALVAAFLVGGTLAGKLEQRAYLRGRAELLDVLRAEGLNRDLLLAQIHEDPAVAKAAEYLKLDRRPAEYLRD